MRKLLLISLLLFGLKSYCQPVPDVYRTQPSPLTGASKNNKAVWDANLYVPLSLRIPRAAAFTLNGAKDSIGYIMFNTISNRFGVYRGSGMWDAYARYDDLNDYYNKTQSDARFVHLTGAESVDGDKTWLGIQYFNYVQILKPGVDINFQNSNGSASVALTTDGVIAGNGSAILRHHTGPKTIAWLDEVPSLSAYSTTAQANALYLRLNGQTQQNIQGIIAPQGISMYGGVSPEVGGITAASMFIGSTVADRKRKIGFYTGAVENFELYNSSDDSFFALGRYASGVFQDNPISVAGATGNISYGVHTGTWTSGTNTGIISGTGLSLTKSADTRYTSTQYDRYEVGVNGGYNVNYGNRQVYTTNPGVNQLTLSPQLTTHTVQLNYPDKPTGTYTLATTSDIASSETLYKDTTVSTGGVNNITIPVLNSKILLMVSRSGIIYYPTASPSPDGQHYYADGTGNIKFHDVITSGEIISAQYKYSAGIPVSISGAQFVFVATYADMVTAATGTQSKLFFVKNDEVNGGTNTDGSNASSIYQYTYNGTTGTLLFYIRQATN